MAYRSVCLSVFIPKGYHNCQLFIVNCQLKNNIPNEAGRPGWDGLFMID